MFTLKARGFVLKLVEMSSWTAGYLAKDNSQV